MGAEKYKNHLYKSIVNQLEKWFMESDRPAEGEDVYRFLHSLKGTAGTIGLSSLMEAAEKLLKHAEQHRRDAWTQSELKPFLFEIIELTYEYELLLEKEEMAKPLRQNEVPLIQIIDDDISLLIFLKDILEKEGWMVLTNADPLKAVKQYFEMRPDCLILNAQLPFKSGFEILGDIHSHHDMQFMPKLMISSDNDRETRLKAYRMGADDFISKPVDTEELTVKVRRHIQRNQMFKQTVLIDELTQVYNRRFYSDTIKQRFQEFSRTGRPFSLAVLDIDHFKKVNDRYGHLTGDHVLSDFAAFLKANVRAADLVFRYGGEEFVILFANEQHEYAAAVLERMIAVYKERVFFHGEEPFHISFSAGVYTVCSPDETPEGAFQKADMSLYNAKKSGRSQVKSYRLQQEVRKKKIVTISIVDDDFIIRTMLTHIAGSLEIDGLEIKTAVYEDGASFLASQPGSAEGSHFLILDGVMPEIDGLEVLRHIKMGSRAEDYLVLMLTGRKSREDVAAALKYGADDYATKPFSVKELTRRIERLLKGMKR